jgi:hypothetical protein
MIIDYCNGISGKTPGMRRHRFDQKRRHCDLLFSICDLRFFQGFSTKIDGSWEQK